MAAVKAAHSAGYLDGVLRGATVLAGDLKRAMRENTDDLSALRDAVEEALDVVARVQEYEEARRARIHG